MRLESLASCTSPCMNIIKDISIPLNVSSLLISWIILRITMYLARSIKYNAGGIRLYECLTSSVLLFYLRMRCWNFLKRLILHITNSWRYQSQAYNIFVGNNSAFVMKMLQHIMPFRTIGSPNTSLVIQYGPTFILILNF